MTDPKTKEHVSFESWEKKETSACIIFGNTYYVACAINRAGQLICLLASLHEPDRVGLIYKLSHLKAKFNKTIIVFIMRATIH